MMVDTHQLTVALAIGLAWFFVLLMLFRPARERLGMLLRIFLLGMVVCVPAGYFNTYWMMALQTRFLSVDVTAVRVEVSMPVLYGALMWILVAPVEEILKYCIVRACTQRRPVFAHPREGCLLAAASALGFATYENYHYMQQVGFEVIYVRGWLCPPGHMLWSSLWGYYLGLAWSRGYKEGPALAEGLTLASVAHGSYNFLCGLIPGWFGLLVPAAVVAGLGRTSWRHLWSGSHEPWLVPKDLNSLKTATSKPTLEVPLSERRFGVVRDPEAQAQVEGLLALMDDLEEKSRIDAVRRAAALEDQRILEKVRELTRDPVAAVREAARATLARLNARLAKR